MTGLPVDANGLLSQTAPPRVLPKQLIRLAIGAAMASFGCAAWGTEPCVLDSIETLAFPSGDAKNPASVEFKLLQSTPVDDPRLVISCEGNALTRLRLQLEPGEQHSIVVVATSGLLMPLSELIEPVEGPASGHWEIVTQALETAPDGSLQKAGVGHQSESIQFVQIDLSADPANHAGQSQTWRIGNSLELVLQDPREERLFRDEFRIDPTLGQFSLLRQAPATRRNEAGPAGTASSQ